MSQAIVYIVLETVQTVLNCCDHISVKAEFNSSLRKHTKIFEQNENNNKSYYNNVPLLRFRGVNTESSTTQFQSSSGLWQQKHRQGAKPTESGGFLS